MNYSVRKALLWTLAALLVGVVRMILVPLLDVWSPDGRLAVSSYTYGFLQTAQIALTGFLAYIFTLVRRPSSLGSK